MKIRFKQYKFKEFMKYKSFYRELDAYFDTYEYRDLKACFEHEVESNPDFIRNVQETADALDLDYELCFKIIKHYCISLFTLMNTLHVCKVKINIYGIMYLETYNHIMNPASGLYCLKPSNIRVLSKETIKKIKQLETNKLNFLKELKNKNN